MCVNNFYKVTWVNQKFGNILVRACLQYISEPKQFKPYKVLTIIGSIVVDGTLIRRALLHSVCDLKAAPIEEYPKSNREYGSSFLQSQSHIYETNKKRRS